MTSLRSKIIRGADIEGVVFCTPGGGIDVEDPAEREERDSLKTLEEFWHSKGQQEGRKAGFEEGHQRGREEGYAKGFEEGEKKGRAVGKEEGLTQGLKEGEEKVRRELQDALSVMQQCQEKLQAQQQVLYEDARPELVKFAVCICERVLRSHLQDSDKLVQMVQTLLLQARPILHDVVADVIVSPEDLQSLQGAIDASYFEVGGVKKINFVAEDSMKRGDCRIETPMGLLNFDIKRILNDLEKKTLEVRSEEAKQETST